MFGGEILKWIVVLRNLRDRWRLFDQFAKVLVAMIGLVQRVHFL